MLCVFSLVFRENALRSLGLGVLCSSVKMEDFRGDSPSEVQVIFHQVTHPDLADHPGVTLGLEHAVASVEKGYPKHLVCLVEVSGQT